tara:strand:+ start:504 stop:1004 length:501 start_codon:yes stop_codon:yes gene_type:complete
VNRLVANILIGLFIISPSIVSSADLKFGFVSTERVFKESGPAVKALKALEKEFKPREQSIQKLGNQVRDLQAKLEKESVTMSESQRRRREQEIAKINREFKREQREFREDLNMRRNEELSVVLQIANKVIEEIAQAEKFDLILQEAVYRSPRIDITDKVIKALADK